MPPLALHNDMHILETQLASNRFDGAVCGSVSQLELIRDMPVKVADPLPGALNAHTVCALLDMGFNRVALSCELTKPQVRDIIKLRPCDLTVYGRTALMHMKHCPISASGGCRSDCASGRYTLSDRRGYVFPVSPVKLTSCLIRIMNSTPTDIITKLDGLRPATCVLDFSLEDASEVKSRILALKSALAGENAQAAQGATGGHWNRGFTV
jgi:collagenase-like PrtC family protease